MLLSLIEEMLYRVSEDLDSILTMITVMTTMTMMTTINDNDDAYRVVEVLNCILTSRRSGRQLFNRFRSGDQLSRFQGYISAGFGLEYYHLYHHLF